MKMEEVYVNRMQTKWMRVDVNSFFFFLTDQRQKTFACTAASSY